MQQTLRSRPIQYEMLAGPFEQRTGALAIGKPRLGREYSFSQVYERNYDDLWLYCFRRSVSAADAEEVLSETFIIAWRKFDQLPSHRDARPWLFTIARNALRNYRRKTNRRHQVHLRLISDAERTGTDDRFSPEVSALNTSSEIAEAFCELRPADQEILALAAWEELTNREICIVLDCTEIAARSRLFRARKSFRKSLESAQRRGGPRQVKVDESELAYRQGQR